MTNRFPSYYPSSRNFSSSDWNTKQFAAGKSGQITTIPLPWNAVASDGKLSLTFANRDDEVAEAILDHYNSCGSGFTSFQLSSEIYMDWDSPYRIELLNSEWIYDAPPQVTTNHIGTSTTNVRLAITKYASNPEFDVQEGSTNLCLTANDPATSPGGGGGSWTDPGGNTPDPTPNYYRTPEGLLISNGGYGSEIDLSINQGDNPYTGDPEDIEWTWYIDVQYRPRPGCETFPNGNVPAGIVNYPGGYIQKGGHIGGFMNWGATIPQLDQWWETGHSSSSAGGICNVSSMGVYTSYAITEPRPGNSPNPNVTFNHFVANYVSASVKDGLAPAGYRIHRGPYGGFRWYTNLPFTQVTVVPRAGYTIASHNGLFHQVNSTAPRFPT